jgi:hypothetical protein
MIVVLEDGTANYNITKESAVEPTGTDTTESDVNLAIDHCSIHDGNIGYFDQSSGMLVGIEGLNHSGSGDFTSRIFDMATSTSIDDLVVSYNDNTYLRNKRLEADMIIHMDLEQSKYTLKENRICLNDFAVGLNGFVMFHPEEYEIDLSFEGKDNSIKSLLSLIPGAFKEGYESVTAEGLLDFTGKISGIYNEETAAIPAFKLKLNAKDGIIQYPELPESVRNIQIDLTVNNDGSEINRTRIDVNKLHLDLGNNPLDARMTIKNLIDYEMEGDISASLNLEDVTKIYPLDSTELGGHVKLDVHVEGVYDSIRQTMPVSGQLNMHRLSYKGP